MHVIIGLLERFVCWEIRKLHVSSLKFSPPDSDREVHGLELNDITWMWGIYHIMCKNKCVHTYVVCCRCLATNKPSYTVWVVVIIVRSLYHYVHTTFKQKIVIRMCMCTRGHQTMITKTSKVVNFWGRFFYNMVILDNNPIHQYNIFLLTSFFELG